MVKTGQLIGQWVGAVAVMIGGLTFHFWLLGVTDRQASDFPHLSDPILSGLPTLQIDVLGEIVFVTILLVFAIYHFRRQPLKTPELFIAIGLLYAARGVFLWLLPIGSPPGAPTDVLQVYPYPNHSYFPGGHVGLISLFAWYSRDAAWRWGFFITSIVFGVGTMLAKAHYTADMFGGLLLSWAVFSFVQWAKRRRERQSMVSS